MKTLTPMNTMLDTLNALENTYKLQYIRHMFYFGTKERIYEMSEKEWSADYKFYHEILADITELDNLLKEQLKELEDAYSNLQKSYYNMVEALHIMEDYGAYDSDKDEDPYEYFREDIEDRVEREITEDDITRFAKVFNWTK